MASSSTKAPATRYKPAKSPESFDSLRRRNMAAEVLQSYEKLSWLSFQRCESIQQTRTYFRAIVAGVSPEDLKGAEKWKEDFTPHPPRPGDEAKRSSRKGKERASLGNAAEGSIAVRTDGSDRKRKEKDRKSVGWASEKNDAASSRVT